MIKPVLYIEQNGFKWHGQEIFEKYFDLDLQHQYEYLFIENLDFSSIPTIVTEKKKNKKIFGFIHSNFIEEENCSKLIANALLELVDGCFVATAFHKAMICIGLAIDYENELGKKIHVTGYPILFEPQDYKKENYVYCETDENGIEFIINTAEAIEDFYRRQNNIDVLDFYIKPLAELDIKSKLINRRLEGLDSIIMPIRIPLDVKIEECKIFFSTIESESFNETLVNSILKGCHPIVPKSGCYPEIVQRDRYMYEPFKLEDCIDKIIEGLKNPSPPKLYVEKYEKSFDLMAQTMLD